MALGSRGLSVGPIQISPGCHWHSTESHHLLTTWPICASVHVSKTLSAEALAGIAKCCPESTSRPMPPVIFSTLEICLMLAGRPTMDTDHWSWRMMRT